MRSSSLTSAALASIAAIAIAAPLAAQGTPPAPPPPPASPGAIAPRAPMAPLPPRAPMERYRIVQRFRNDSAFRNRPTLGLSLAPTGSSRDTLGAFVIRVAPGGPAERAGIIEGDRIVAIDGVSLKTNPADIDDPYAAALPVHRVSRAVDKLTPGRTVSLRVYANGRYRDVTVTVGRTGDVYKGRHFMIYSMGDIDGVVAPALAAVGPALESVGPELERIGPMLQRMGPMINESVTTALESVPRHMDIEVETDSVTTHGRDPVQKRDAH